MRLLSTGDLSEITGLPVDRVGEWCEKGILKPLDAVEGTGNHRRFSEMQAVGLAVALAVRATEHSCVLSYVGQIVAAFGAMSEEDLERQIAKSGPCLMSIHQGRPWLGGAQFEWVNVKTILADTKRKIEKLRAKSVGRPKGSTKASRNTASRNAKMETVKR